MECSTEFLESLRFRVRRAERSAYEVARGSHRLTLVALGDAPDDVGFTFWEARSRGWAPILAGRVGSRADLAVTFCALDVEEQVLGRLAEFLDETADFSEPALETSPVSDINTMALPVEAAP